MASVGVPIPTVALASAIVFLLVGSVSVAVGYRARFGALLLLLFLIPRDLLLSRAVESGHARGSHAAGYPPLGRIWD